MKIGILTFHRVYNYGAVLQAYALQQVLFEAGYDNEIIDFSKEKQEDYTSLYSIRNGKKRFIKTIILLPFDRQRRKRKNLFLMFFKNDMVLSKKRFKKEKELKGICNDYEIFITGSDQVWNVEKESDSSSAYFLDFVPEEKKKIAYAPSIGIANEKELLAYKSDLLKFQAISCREKEGTKLLETLLGKKIDLVLDPTLLADEKIFLKYTSIYKGEPYLLYYSLDGFDKRKNNMDILLALAEKFNLKIKLITPEWLYHNKKMQSIIDAGPKEFLNLIKNASLVCTNSFHGTALSIKMKRPIYVLEDRKIKDERKRSILKQLGIENRILSTVKEIENVDSYQLNYEIITVKLEKIRKESWKFLMNAIEG